MTQDVKARHAPSDAAIEEALAVIERAIAEAVEKERARIVAWLREQVTCGCGRSDCIADNYPLGYAEQIERGDHKERADG